MPRRFHIWSALVAAVLTAAYSLVCFSGGECFYRLWYYVPAATLAGAVVAERICNRRSMTLWQWSVDVLLSLLCLARPLYGFPPISGHAVFSLHALMTGRSKTTKVLTVVSLLITLFAKIVLWNWDRTLWPGLLLGMVGGLVWRFTGPSEKKTIA